MHWFNITAAAGKHKLDELESWFWDQGAVSVTVEDGEDKPIYEPPPGEQPVWEEVLVTGLFESDVIVDELETGLTSAGFNLHDISKVENKPWEREWLERFKPMQFGQRLWVCPTGYDLPEEDKVIIHLDPGLAFGTGTHETTRLCLEYLDSLNIEAWDVVDFGCGSGVLAIAAALLGARDVLAIDNDPQALTATADNASRNKVSVTTAMPPKSLVPVDLVLANILAQPLVELSDLLLSGTRKGGLLVLSGIMSSQSEWVEAAYSGRAELVDRTELDGWMRLVWRH